MLPLNWLAKNGGSNTNQPPLVSGRCGSNNLPLLCKFLPPLGQWDSLGRLNWPGIAMDLSPCYPTHQFASWSWPSRHKMSTRVFVCISAYQKNCTAMQLACSNRTRTSAHTHVFWALWSELVRCLHGQHMGRNIPGNFVGWTGCTHRRQSELVSMIPDSLRYLPLVATLCSVNTDVFKWFMEDRGNPLKLMFTIKSTRTCHDRYTGIPNLVMTYYARSSCYWSGQNPSPKSLFGDSKHLNISCMWLWET